MGDKIVLKLDEREVHGKKVAKLRKEGIVPGVVYGPGIDPISVLADDVSVAKVFAASVKHAPLHLTIGSKKKIAMIKDAEIDPVKHRLRHISFHAVKASDPVVAEVPIQLVGEGESEAEKAGLIVLQALDKVEVKALPMDLPDSVQISIVELREPGEKVTLADAKLPEGVEFVEHDDGHHDDDEEKPSITDLMVASVWEPAALQAQNEAAAGEAEPGDEAEVEADQGEDTNQPANAAEGKSEGNKDFEKKGE